MMVPFIGKGVRIQVLVLGVLIAIVCVCVGGVILSRPSQEAEIEKNV